MTDKNYSRTAFCEKADCRNSSAQTIIVCDFSVFNRNVQCRPYKYRDILKYFYVAGASHFFKQVALPKVRTYENLRTHAQLKIRPRPTLLRGLVYCPVQRSLRKV